MIPDLGIIIYCLPFLHGNDDPTTNSFDEYYMPQVEIKDFNALIDNKPFFDQPVKNKQEGYDKLIKILKKWHLSDYLYHQNYYKLIGIDLSRQTNMSIPPHINFVGKLEEGYLLKSSKKLL